MGQGDQWLDRREVAAIPENGGNNRVVGPPPVPPPPLRRGRRLAPPGVALPGPAAPD